MLDIYSAKTIEDADLKRPQMIVDDLLPAGLTVFAGSPKLGKSWLMLLLCACVADQKPFLGRRTNQGGVLLLDLEGSQVRLHDRLSQLGYGFPDYLQVAHKAPSTDADGLISALDEWWATCEQIPRLVVIDTIVRVKGVGKKGLNSYENDSSIFAPLQEYALQKGIAIIAVTHLKKTNSFIGAEDDWLERISGSMGLAGVADNVWGLFRKRGADAAYLRISSRDVDASDMVIQFNNGLWTFKSDDIDKYEFETSAIVQFIDSIKGSRSGYAAEMCEQYISFCDENNLSHGLSETQPVASLGKQMKSVQSELWRIRKQLTISRKGKGMLYTITEF